MGSHCSFVRAGCWSPGGRRDGAWPAWSRLGGAHNSHLGVHTHLDKPKPDGDRTVPARDQDGVRKSPGFGPPQACDSGDGGTSRSVVAEFSRGRGVGGSLSAGRWSGNLEHPREYNALPRERRSSEWTGGCAAILLVRSTAGRFGRCAGSRPCARVPSAEEFGRGFGRPPGDLLPADVAWPAAGGFVPNGSAGFACDREHVPV